VKTAADVNIQAIKKKPADIHETPITLNSFLDIPFLEWNWVEIHIKAPIPTIDTSTPKLYKKIDSHLKPEKSPFKSLSPM